MDINEILIIGIIVLVVIGLISQEIYIHRNDDDLDIITKKISNYMIDHSFKALAMVLIPFIVIFFILFRYIGS